MFYWQTKLLVILLIAFSGFNLIQSDCGADVDRLSGGCNNNRDLRRIDDLNYEKDFERRSELTRRGMFKPLSTLLNKNLNSFIYF